MKTVTVVVLGLVWLVGGLGAGSPAEAAEYLGEICWSFAYTDSPISGTVRLGVSHLGGGHYLLSGSQTWGTHQAPLHGSAQVIGETIELTLTMAESAALASSAANGGTPTYSVLVIISHAVLNPLTLNGGLWALVTESALSTPISGYIAGTLTRMACP